MKVVEISRGSVSTAYCGHLLASLGNDVTKLEPPLGGDPLRRWGPFHDDRPRAEGGLFMSLNRGKDRVQLDVESVTGREILRRMIAGADVVIHNLSPVEVEQIGIGADLNRDAGQLITAALSGFGSAGPYAGAPCYPINATALGGISVGIGAPNRKPLTIPFGLGEYQAGLVAAIGVLACALARKYVGGQNIDVSEADVWATVHTGQNVLTFLYLGVSGLRAANHGIGQYPNSFLKCKDGYVCITLTPLAQWLKLLEIMDNPEWTKEPRYRDRRAMTEEYPDEVDALIAPWFEDRTAAEILEIAKEAGLPIVPAFEVGDLLENEHLKARDTFVVVASGEEESYLLPRLPFKTEALATIDRRERRPRLALAERFGVDSHELDALFECEVI